MRLFYTFGIYIYYLLIKLFSIFNEKARFWINGRKNWENNIVPALKSAVWVHCASLGEFEQGRTIIEKIKSENPASKIILTFFSPSGYEIRKNYEFADLVMYLPLDTPENVSRFIELVQPKMAIFIKYEFWFNFINQLYIKKIPIYFVSTIFRSNQHFFQWWGFWFRHHLHFVNHFFVQDRNSQNLLRSIDIKNVTISGDTRFDRVYQITRFSQEFREIEEFVGNSKCLIAGSTWEPDEKLISEFTQTIPEIKVIIAPHQIDEIHLQKIEKLFHKHKIIRHSNITNSTNLQEYEILLIDSIGKLMHLYKYADYAYIGGGFGVGIHNILEAATFSKPVFFGPNYHKFNEATELIALGGAYTIMDSEDLVQLINKMNDNQKFYDKVSKQSSQYVSNKLGATEIIVKTIAEDEKF